jgi:hypothetical protein
MRMWPRNLNSLRITGIVLIIARRHNRGWVGLDLDAQPCRLAKPFAAGLQQRP